MSTGQQRVTGRNVNLPPGIDRLPSGALRVRVYGPDGKRRTVGTYSSDKDAREALAQAVTETVAGSYTDRRRGLVTLDAWFREWMPDRPVRPITLHSDWGVYRRHIQPYLGTMPLIKITPYQVRRWLTQLERDGRSVALRKKAHTLLKTSLGLHGAMGDERLKTNPCVIVKAPLPQRRRWTLLTRPQFDTIYSHVPADWQPIVLLAAHTGLRWSEIAGLQAKDYTGTQLHIRRGLTYLPKQGLREGTTKSTRSRVVPLSKDVRQALDAHLKANPTVGNGWLFTRDGQPLAIYHQQAMWKKVTNNAKINCRFHDLRHSCASWLLAAGATLAEVRDMLGHASIVTTELYLHVDDEGLAATVDRAFG